MQRDVVEEMCFRIEHCWIEGEFDDECYIFRVDRQRHKPEEKKYLIEDCKHCGAVFSVSKITVRNSEYFVCEKCGKTPKGVQWRSPNHPVHINWE